MNTSLHPAAEQWVGLINGELACHTGVIQFPMRKGWKRVHRLVVLPDYQGVGIGTIFQDDVVKKYIDDNWNVNCTTTTPALVNSLRGSKKWKLVRSGRSKSSMNDFIKYGTGDLDKDKKIAKSIVKAQSNNRVTYSFNYIKTAK